MFKIEKKIKGYITQFVIFLIFYLMMFGVGISIIFNDRPLLVLAWIMAILIFVLSFTYYSGTRVIYKVEIIDDNLMFYSCFRRYRVDKVIEFKKKKIGYFVMMNGKKLRFPFYTGIPSKHNKYWEESEIEIINNRIVDLKNHVDK